MRSDEKKVECSRCNGDGRIHDADFSDGDSDQQMYLMQDTMRQCPRCKGSGFNQPTETNSPKPEPMTAERLANLTWYAEQWKPNPLSQDVLDLVVEISRLKSENASFTSSHDATFTSMRSTEDQLIRVAGYVGATCGDDGFTSGDDLAASIIRKVANLKQLLRDCPVELIGVMTDNVTLPEPKHRLVRIVMSEWLDARQKALE